MGKIVLKFVFHKLVDIKNKQLRLAVARKRGVKVWYTVKKTPRGHPEDLAFKVEKAPKAGSYSYGDSVATGRVLTCTLGQHTTRKPFL